MSAQRPEAHIPQQRISLLGCLSIIAASAGTMIAQTPATPTSVLFANVRIFDGKSLALSKPANVLVAGNKIQHIAFDPIPTDSSVTTTIDGGGRTLMPGLIDAHTHLMYSTITQFVALFANIGYINVVATNAARDMLFRGFTSARDMGGPVFGLKLGIDQGLTVGPRIWPAGAMISQSGGHGDFRAPNQLPAPADYFDYIQRSGGSIIADGADAVLQRSREQLALGASQVKIMAGGGVASSFDPLDVVEYTLPEIQAAVSAARNWGTYVAVHAYTPPAVKQAIDAGVLCIEHGQLLDEETASLMVFSADDPSPFPDGSPERLKDLAIIAGTDKAYKLAKKYQIKTAWGTDNLFSAASAKLQNLQLSRLARWYSPAEVLKMATGDNGQLLTLSGPRNPYPGQVGVVQEGALADLILVDGDPTADIKLIQNPASKFLLIMKDGQIYKNTIPNP